MAEDYEQYVADSQVLRDYVWDAVDRDVQGYAVSVSEVSRLWKEAGLLADEWVDINRTSLDGLEAACANHR